MTISFEITAFLRCIEKSNWNWASYKAVTWIIFPEWNLATQSPKCFFSANLSPFDNYFGSMYVWSLIWLNWMLTVILRMKIFNLLIFDIFPCLGWREIETQFQREKETNKREFLDLWTRISLSEQNNSQ